MSATTHVPAGPEEPKPGKTPRAPKNAPRCEGSREAKRLAAAILEVLGGARLPSGAAAALGLSLPRYYFLELRALQGLVAACEPRPQGRTRSAESELLKARKENDRLTRECARYAALARALQRSIGLAQAPKAAPAGKGKGRARRPSIRALKAARVLELAAPGETEAGSAGEQLAKG